MTRDDLLTRLDGVRPSGDGHVARCPAHEDGHASLSVGIGDDGRILLHCHAGCDPLAICMALGITMRDLMPAMPARQTLGRIIETYDYHDASGTLLYQVCRFSPKAFRPRRPDGRGGWIWNLESTPRVLYKLPEVAQAAQAHRHIWIVEGEKDVVNLAKLGFIATTNSGGAGKWSDDFSRCLVGCASVVVIADADGPGRKHAQAVAESLYGAGVKARVIEMPGFKDASAFLDAGHDKDDLLALVKAAPLWTPTACHSLGGDDAKRAVTVTNHVTLDDFYAYMPMHLYIFAPTRDMWPGASVNARIPPIRIDEKTIVGASHWLDKNRPVEQMTWWPGRAQIIEDHVFAGGELIYRAGNKIFNSYRAPAKPKGNPANAKPWADLIRKLYPGEADHIMAWCAHRVQCPHEKVNHALVLGGLPGIGKDTILAPVRETVGVWNFAEESPAAMLGSFNPYVRAVILRINEVRDTGEANRYSFYEHMKGIIAAPPEVISCNEKHLRPYAIPNVVGVVMTTNHKTGGIYLPANDRRHFVAWSETEAQRDFDPGFWTGFYSWLEQGGAADVAAFLATYDLSQFDAKAPPQKTAAFWEIVAANQAPEDDEMMTAIEALGRPDVLLVKDIAECPQVEATFRDWILDRRNARQIAYRLETAGYILCRNPASQAGGRWRIDGRQTTVYGRQDLDPRERIVAARARAVGDARAHDEHDEHDSYCRVLNTPQTKDPPNPLIENHAHRAHHARTAPTGCEFHPRGPNPHCLRCEALVKAREMP
ncbi:MAG: toprim domain-containing protein [Vicinamibacteria bacterium]|nr:toprim domain-containing protein [Vicinamibacteria bacterium]